MDETAEPLHRLRPLSPQPTGLTPRGKLDQPVKAILFDIYGTLFISAAGDIRRSLGAVADAPALQQLLNRYAIQQRPADLVERLEAAIAQDHRQRRKQGADHPEVDIEQIWADVLAWDDPTLLRHFAATFERLVNPVWPMPHLKELIQGCRRRHLVMGLVSNAQFYTSELFRRFLKSDPAELGFSPPLCIYSYQHGRAKPSPYLFQLAHTRLRRMGLQPRQVLFVGNDMRNDILPAHQVGFATALFAGDKRSLRLRSSDPQCRALSPNLLLTDLFQLMEHLNLTSRA
jgi:putative hydrolase of the HAD superfamily